MNVTVKVVWLAAGMLVSIPVVFTVKSPDWTPMVLTPLIFNEESPVFLIVKVFGVVGLPESWVPKSTIVPLFNGVPTGCSMAISSG